ncbi:uncharacterized protein LY89DRAFT_678409 [Mollisia scopiformis]|uniref:Zn(2)-C6 fungal-type domain-containing protein n=1 Tax=Mollisia scopiformis TaxID=149040 RepID=A0A132B347_MOLSC|nr:uncharacterized protein LY89DRAFT_678409 [Mollisia scopiformis]KUJ06828.1 hypothetical protein LY89DRAFT_678409 [Mollisia scopiformis]
MQKQRVSRACDTCKRRKIRCTGKQPCAHCIKNNKTCEFKAAYTRGAVPEVQSAPLEEQEKFLEEVGYKRRQVWRPSPGRRNHSHVRSNEQDDARLDTEEEDSEYDGETAFGYPSVPSSRPIPTRQHQDSTSGTSNTSTQPSHITPCLRDRVANNSSATSLYDRTQHNIHTRDYHHRNPVYAYGDPALPDIDATFLIIPSQNTAHAIIRKYFDYVSATNRILHFPTVEKWTVDLLNNIRDMRTGAEENSHRAVVLMLFALTYEYMGDEYGEWDANSSFYYFQAAENQLAKETGEIRLATLQARLLQCLYLLSRSRINQCYSIFGTVVNFIYAIGIHRERRPSSTSDLLEIEMQKRVFWGAYVMDKYLSSSLGRPQLIQDEDIDQELPLLVEDENLSSGFLQTTSKEAQVPMRGAIYQIKLSKIMSQIMRELYSVQRHPLEVRFAAASQLNLALRTWRGEIAHFLDLDPSLLSPLYMRQNMALRLSYSHALILLHRPFLLDTFDSHLDISLPVLLEKLEENVNNCMNAALDVVKTIDSLHKVESSFNASWFAHYCAYTAIVALYLHVIRRYTSCPFESMTSTSAETINSRHARWMLQFEAASKCQEQIKNSSTMAKESFAQKCSVVLEEARAEAVLKIRQAKTRQGKTWGDTEESESRSERENMEGVSEGVGNERPHVQMEETSFFGGEWNDMNFAPFARSSFRLA